MNSGKIWLAVALFTLAGAPCHAGPAPVPSASGPFAVGAQYDTTHVYVPETEFDRFVACFSATFGGSTTKSVELQVTPTPSRTRSQLVLTPSGSVSVFGFETPVPYPFGDERNGYLVSDMDDAVDAALAVGAVRRIATFPDPVGRDAVVQWPGGVNMQLYWHKKAPNYPALRYPPEARVYLTPEAAEPFIKAWTAFSHGRISSDDPKAGGAEIGRPGGRVRRVVITSKFGPTVVLISDGVLPWPFGRDVTGYAVADLDAALRRAQATGGTVVGSRYEAAGRPALLIMFPGGYVAEIHQATTG